jgi:cytoskeletal protein CcmA (bactofilin family)
MAIQENEESTQNTVIGESSFVEGKIEGDEDLTVLGRVQGTIVLTKTLIVQSSGVVKADAQVRNAVISGLVVGNIVASESVHLTKEGRMVGDIHAPRVILVEGAGLRGRVEMGETPQPKIREKTARPKAVTSRVASASNASANKASASSRGPRFTALVKSGEGKNPVPQPPPLKISSAEEGEESSEEEVALASAGLAKKKVVVKRKK